MKIILPNQEIIGKYVEKNKIISEGQKGQVKDVDPNIKIGDFIKVRVTKIDPMRGFESNFISKFEKKSFEKNKSNNDRYDNKNNINKKGLNAKKKYLDVNSKILDKKLNEIRENEIGQFFRIKVKVIEVKQTKGPTIFTVYDGTRISVAKGFEKAGERAYPDINVGDRINAEVKVSTFDNSIELLIEKYNFLSKKEDDELINNIELESEKKAKVNDWNFLIKSDVLNKMKVEFEGFSKIINLAIIQNRPIHIKHHADCDGLSAAIALERAVLSKMLEVYAGEMIIRHNYKRSISKTPFYDYYDASRDTAMFLEDSYRFGTKAPLIICLDFGSSVESLLSYRKLKSSGAEIIILDHHQIGSKEKEIILEYAQMLVNPTLYGVDYDFSAGMLATEVAHFIHNDIDVDYLAALSGIGDRIISKELDEYIKVAEELGYSKDYLVKLAEVIDFEIYNLKFMQAREYYDSLLTKTDEQVKMVNYVYEQISQRKEVIKKTIAKTKEIVEKENKTLIKLNLEKDFKRDFPTSGRIVGLCSDTYKEKYDKLLCIGYDYDLIIIRAKENTGFDVHELLDILYEKYEYAQVDGGGHKLVGSIKFIPSALESILKEIENYYFNKI